MRGVFAEAERTYKLAVLTRPDYWGMYNQLDAFYVGRAQYDKAARMFQMVTELTPESSLGYQNLGGVDIYTDFVLYLFGRYTGTGGDL